MPIPNTRPEKDNQLDMSMELAFPAVSILTEACHRIGVKSVTILIQGNEAILSSSHCDPFDLQKARAVINKAIDETVLEIIPAEKRKELGL